MTPDQRDDVILALDTLCPMHCLIDPKGEITHVGPTLQKLRPRDPMPGMAFLDLFQMTYPRAVHAMQDLRAVAGRQIRLRLHFRDLPRTGLQGVLVPHGQGGALVNLAFGISILDAVKEYALTSSDFAATDPTVEMLFLVEAKSAAMEASRDLTRQLQTAKIAAEEQAFTDTLTGLKNRRALDHILHRLIEAGQIFALMHLDLDYFKAVNDTLGHAAGDHVLERVARILIAETRTEDIVARVGGDEFVLIFAQPCDLQSVDSIAQRLIQRLEKPIQWEGEVCRVSASLGTVLSLDYAPPTARGLLADADRALYDAKRTGRGRHSFHHELAGQRGGTSAPRLLKGKEQCATSR